MIEINKKLIIFIIGDPKHGKSYLAQKLNDVYKNSIVISTDMITVDFISTYHPHKISELHNIFDMYHELPYKVQVSLLSSIYRTITIKCKKKNNVIIVEGYILKFLNEKLIKEIRDTNSLIEIEAKCQSYHINKSDDSINVNDVEAIIHNQILADELSHINYQYFENIHTHVFNSNSLEKFNRLNITHLLNDKTFLDIGCNTGYFCFKAIENRASSAVGIDTSIDALNTASALQHGIFQYLNVNFYYIDFFDYESEKLTDIILCASTFHYFRERQQVFFNKCYQLLEKNGILVLECGISDEDSDKKDIKKYSRDVDDTPCFFPTRSLLMDMANEFTLIYEGDSVSQPGDSLKRKVFHFQKLA